LLQQALSFLHSRFSEEQPHRLQQFGRLACARSMLGLCEVTPSGEGLERSDFPLLALFDLRHLLKEVSDLKKLMLGVAQPDHLGCRLPAIVGSPVLSSNVHGIPLAQLRNLPTNGIDLGSWFKMGVPERTFAKSAVLASSSLSRSSFSYE
jgi:hypothetical protein